MRLWEQAQPIAGTPAIQYLADVRRIDTGALPAGIETVLRFHPRCPFGPGTRHPCLLALMRDGVADAPTGIQRIALTPEVLAGGEVERRMLGRAGAVKLWPAASSLVIGEGIETVLAAATRIPYRGAPLQPAWSTLTSGKLSTFPVLPGVERLIILVDHDINGAGQLAATVCIGALDPRRPHRRPAHAGTRRRRFQRSGHAGVSAMSFSEEISEPCAEGRGVTIDDFRAYMPAHAYIFMPCCEFWPATSVNSRLPPMPVLDEHGQAEAQQRQARHHLRQQMARSEPRRRADDVVPWATEADLEPAGGGRRMDRAGGRHVFQSLPPAAHRAGRCHEGRAVDRPRPQGLRRAGRCRAYHPLAGSPGAAPEREDQPRAGARR